MTVNELVNKLDLQVYTLAKGLVHEVSGGYVSDLLSDVMGNAKEGQVWVTLQNHKNVVAIASLKELAAVILVKGIQPEPETLQHANEENIPILGTALDTFEIVGRLYNAIHSENHKG